MACVAALAVAVGMVLCILARRWTATVVALLGVLTLVAASHVVVAGGAAVDQTLGSDQAVTAGFILTFLMTCLGAWLWYRLGVHIFDKAMLNVKEAG